MMSKLKHSAAALLIAGVATPTVAEDSIPVNIGFPPAVHFLPVMMSAENGCFEEQGLDATLTIIPIVTSIGPSLLGGSLQIGMSTPTSLLAAADNGLPIVAIAGASRNIVGNESISIVSTAGTTVNSAEDLAGMKVGVPGVLSVGDLVFRTWLDQSIDSNSVTYVETPFPRMAEMLNAGTVDAVLAADPARGGIVAAGLGERASVEFYSTVLEDSIQTLWTSSTAWAEANPRAIAGFRACLEEGITAIAEDPARAVEVQEQYLQFSIDDLPDFTSTVSADDLAAFLPITRAYDVTRNDIDTSALVLE